jgi:hypothetical protein
MAKVSMPKLEGKSFSGWVFVLITGLLLALYAIIDRGGLNAITVADGSTGCQLEVTTDRINVRAGPSQDTEQLRVLTRGEVVDGTRVVVNLYRQLEDGTWATGEFLTPVPGSNCT